MSTLEGDPIKLRSGKVINKLKSEASLYLDKTILLYGPSGSGKTVIIKHIMYTLKNYIEQCLIMSPSEPTNHSFEGVVPPQLLHFTFPSPDPKAKKTKKSVMEASIKFLEDIWARQEMMAAIYNKANNINVLKRLYARLPNSITSDWNAVIDELDIKRSSTIKQIKKQYSSDVSYAQKEIGVVNEKFDQLVCKIYRKIVILSADILSKMKLTEDEMHTLTYVEFNPRMLLVFDDCAADMVEIMKSDTVKKFFYRGRHVYLTLIFSTQADTEIPANIRKNSFINFFTKGESATCNFLRASNNYSPDTKSLVNEISQTLFEGHRKLAYIREDKKGQNFYYIEAPVHEQFMFGSNAIIELCNSVKSDGSIVDQSNPYYKKFIKSAL